MAKSGFSVFLFLSLIGWCINSCSPSTENQSTGSTMRVFGKMSDGREVKAYVLENSNGMQMEVISYGGIITKLLVPDKAGKLEDVVLGYDNLQSYIDNNPYFGAIIGRYGNRIAKGKFSLEGQEYELAINNIGNHLHGGLVGFDKVLWDVEPFVNKQGSGLVLSYLSEDGEEGYPGNLKVDITYTIGEDNTLDIAYAATTDKTTVINLTQHSYFNLSGMKEDILGHELELNSSNYLPVDSTLIPTGEQPVASTPFDFTSRKRIDQDIAVDDQQINYGGGFDHCWVIDEGDSDLKLAATLFHSQSGRKMEVLTTEPGIQFYSGNFLDGSITGKNGIVYDKRFALCLETQHFPDSPNQSNFPSTVLSPGEEYTSKTIYKFSVE